MEVSRGANLVGMSVLPLDACPLSLPSKKNIYEKSNLIHIQTKDNLVILTHKPDINYTDNFS